MKTFVHDANGSSPFRLSRETLVPHFVLTCALPQVLPFWGVYYGSIGFVEFLAIVDSSVDLKVVTPACVRSEDGVICVEYRVEMTKHNKDNDDDKDKDEDDTEKTDGSKNQKTRFQKTALCHCRDVYDVSQSLVVGIHRSFLDAELCLPLFQE